MFLYDQFIGMMIESYSLICVCCMISFHKNSFETYGEKVQTIVNFFFFFLSIVFPLVVTYIVKKDWDPVEKEWKNRLIIERRFGAMFGELSLDNGPYVLIWPLYFMLRRLLMALIVVIFRNFLWMQIFLCAMTIVTAVIIIGESNYFESNSKRTMEFANECLVMLMLYNMISFSPFVPEIETRFNMGYICCLLEAAALAVNLWLILLSNVKGVIYEARLWFAKRHMSRWRIRFLRARAKGMVLRSRRARERATREWDYGYEDDREFYANGIEKPVEDEEVEDSEEEKEEEEIEIEAPKQVILR